MRIRTIPMLALLLATVLACAPGCKTVTCATESTVAAVGGAWDSVCDVVTPDPEPVCESREVEMSRPVYANWCGGDNDIGRGGTGAFRIP